MNDLESRVTSNINSIIMMLVSKGVKKISLPRLALFINREFNIQIDDNNLSDILSKNSSVASIEGNIINFGAKQNEDDMADDDIHNMAVDQASENLTSESIDLKDNFKLFENIHIGDEYSAKNIKLNINDKDYFKHCGAKKIDATYIVTDICPNRLINESYVRCKIKGESLFIEIPINAIVNKTKK